MLITLLLCSVPAEAKKVEIPVDLGLGPAIIGISGPVRQDQAWHYGAALSLEAIIDNETIRKFKGRIPQQYRKMALSIDELRIRPLWFLLPQTVYLSPATQNTGVWGASWELIGISVPLVADPFRLAPEIGIPFTWMSISSTTLPSPTQFLRLGLEGGVDLVTASSMGELWVTGNRFSAQACDAYSTVAVERAVPAAAAVTTDDPDDLCAVVTPVAGAPYRTAEEDALIAIAQADLGCP